MVSSRSRCSLYCILIYILAFSSLAFAAGSLEGGLGRNSKPVLMMQTGHIGTPLEAQFSQDGTYFLSAGGDGLVMLWDVASGKQIRSFRGHRGAVFSLAISPAGDEIATAGEDGTVRLWNLITGYEIRSYQGHDGIVSSVRFLDNERLVSGGWDGSVRVWQKRSGEEIGRFSHKEKVMSVEILPGSRIVSGSWDATVKIWEVTSGKMTGELKLDVLKNDADPEIAALSRYYVDAVAIVGDGATLAMVIGGFNKQFTHETRVLFWNITNSRMLKISPVKLGHASAKFLPDNRTLISGSGNDVVLIDSQTGDVIRRLTGHGKPVRSVACSQDGNNILSGSEEMSLILHETKTGKRIQQFSRDLWPTNLNFDNSFSFIGDGSGVYAQAHLWSLALTGDVLWLQTLKDVMGATANGRFVFSRDWNDFVDDPNDFIKFNRIVEWDVRSKEPVSKVDMMELPERDQIAGNGSYYVTYDGAVMAIGSDTPVSKLEGYANINSYAFSGDNSLLLGGGGDLNIWKDKGAASLQVWDVASGKLRHTLTGHTDNISAVATSPNGMLAASGSYDGTLRLWELESGKELKTLALNQGWIGCITFSADGTLMAASSRFGTITVWETKTGIAKGTLSGHRADVRGLVFSSDSRLLISGNNSEPAILWDLASSREIAKLVALHDRNYSWIIVTPDGRFDTNNLDDIRGLHWVMPDDPFKPVAVETFMRDYYEPRLLPRLLGGEKFNPVRDLQSLNRVQPKVTIASVQREGEGSTVTVTVDVAKDSHDFQQDSRKVTLSTGVHDFKLFRAGQLVGFREGNIKLDEKNGTARLSFSGIKLPRGSGTKEIEFSAYAFNDDGIKSSTSRQKFPIPADLTPVKGTAYLVTIGVNKHQNPAWDLKFAVNDAKKISDVLTSPITKTDSYTRIVTITLPDELATKEHIKAVFDLLTGKNVTASLVKEIPNADKLKKATPEDLLIISFSGHGHVDNSGAFYTFTHDTGIGTERAITTEFLKHIVSSNELSEWLRYVDAGQMALIIDACHSAATVGEGFKAGPMGSRGLGQLAYDKGMRILAASQADDFALESDKLQHGLLTYALTRDGIEAGQADFKPKDQQINLAEWLEYGVDRVPKLYEEVKNNKISAYRGDTSRAAVIRFNKNNSLAKKNLYQTPSLFDFTKGKRDAALVR